MKRNDTARYAFWLTLIIFFILLHSAIAPGSIFADFSDTQTNQDETPERENLNWDEPLNLSLSGSATEPQVVIAADGTVHAIWREDAVNSFFYARQENGRWIEPIQVELPFGTRRYTTNIQADGMGPLYNPRLVLDAIGRIHAFWLDENNALYYSQVPAVELANFSSWRAREQLATSALAFDATVDGANGVHLGYVRDLDSPEAPAGIYYRQTIGENQAWSEPVTIYQSAYYRAISADDANIHITTAGEEVDPAAINVLIAWDNRPLEQVYLNRSTDGGASWGAPQIIDERQPEDPITVDGPFAIDVVGAGSEVLVAWSAGDETPCLQYQQSSDSGATWQSPQAISAVKDQDCPEVFEFIPGHNNLLFLLTTIGNETFLQAFDGKQWSEPQQQMTLAGFTDSVTFRPVNFGCLQTNITAGNHLLVLGCGASQVNDIWALERPLGDIDTWFPPTEALVWSQPTALLTRKEHFSSPVLLTTTDGLLHSFWIGTGNNAPGESNAKVYYTQWDGESWSRIVPLLNLNYKNADQLAGAIDKNGHIFLLWRNADENTFYYSRVNAESVLLPTDWSVPQEFLESETLVSNPALNVDHTGMIKIIYAIPLNENRGIYLRCTQDGGQTWLEPLLIVDAVAADWKMVDSPQIVQSNNGHLHAIWTNLTLGPDPIAIELYYARSEDAGQNWSEPELIIPGTIKWSRLISMGEQELLAVWQQQDGDRTSIWYRQSFNDGATWEQPLGVLAFDTPVGQPALAADKSNRQHLVQTVANNVGDLRLQNWVWQGDSWLAGDDSNLNINLADVTFHDLAVNLAPNGYLKGVFFHQTNSRKR